MNKICKTYIILQLLSALALLLIGCKSKIQYVPIKETEIVKEIRRDTIVDVKLIPYKDSVAVLDTASYLKNDYAYSWAKWSGGMLHHSLGIFDKDIPVKIEYKEKETIRYKEIPVEVEGETVYINELNWYQSFCVWFTSGVLIAAFLFLLYKYRSKIFGLIKKLIF